MRIVIFTVMLLFLTAFSGVMIAVSQEPAAGQQSPAAPAETPVAQAPIVQDRNTRGSIPEALWRPARGEAPRYPVDTVIGELGKGKATEAAYNFAVSVCEGLLSGDAKNTSLATVNSASRESYLSTIEIIGPVGYRIGGGREEADGAFSFLVRFLGREHGISGELYVRYRTRVNQQTGRTTGLWIFEELLLDEVKERVKEQQESIYRYDFNPYERFF